MAAAAAAAAAAPCRRRALQALLALAAAVPAAAHLTLNPMPPDLAPAGDLIVRMQALPRGGLHVVYASGLTYDGGFEDGVRQGAGRLARPSQTVYEGGFKDGRPHGSGLAIYRAGEGGGVLQYSGMWHRGVYHGQGYMVHSSGLSFTGPMENGQFGSNGTWTYPNGGRYEGPLRQGFPHGKGTFQLHRDPTAEQPKGPQPELAYYHGKWHQGVQQDANATGHWTDGSRYRGEWADGRAHGAGRHWALLPGGGGTEVYEGAFFAGRRHGVGSLWHTRAVPGAGLWAPLSAIPGLHLAYRGGFAAGLANGSGSEWYPNQERYEGNFREGLRHGSGTCFAAGGAARWSGQWTAGSAAAGGAAAADCGSAPVASDSAKAGGPLGSGPREGADAGAPSSWPANVVTALAVCAVAACCRRRRRAPSLARRSGGGARQAQPAPARFHDFVGAARRTLRMLANCSRGAAAPAPKPKAASAAPPRVIAAAPSGAPTKQRRSTAAVAPPPPPPARPDPPQPQPPRKRGKQRQSGRQEAPQPSPDPEPALLSPPRCAERAEPPPPLSAGIAHSPAAPQGSAPRKHRHARRAQRAQRRAAASAEQQGALGPDTPQQPSTPRTGPRRPAPASSSRHCGCSSATSPTPGPPHDGTSTSRSGLGNVASEELLAELDPRCTSPSAASSSDVDGELPLLEDPDDCSQAEDDAQLDSVLPLLQLDAAAEAEPGESIVSPLPQCVPSSPPHVTGRPLGPPPTAARPVPPWRMAAAARAVLAAQQRHARGGLQPDPAGLPLPVYQPPAESDLAQHPAPFVALVSQRGPPIPLVPAGLKVGAFCGEVVGTPIRPPPPPKYHPPPDYKFPAAAPPASPPDGAAASACGLNHKAEPWFPPTFETTAAPGSPEAWQSSDPSCAGN
eukprot:TRINITY_DN407_c1_g1_i5.p1 TRINITY_DN407_c1_g1~~TRINITY_DN407_c1_g1_i5.p1  ORF type:complete len:901 (+),score=146.59 TRINITY_DN407_c1_g1_i5:82-2784(+)